MSDKQKEIHMIMIWREERKGGPLQHLHGFGHLTLLLWCQLRYEALHQISENDMTRKGDTKNTRKECQWMGLLTLGTYKGRNWHLFVPFLLLHKGKWYPKRGSVGKSLRLYLQMKKKRGGGQEKGEFIGEKVDDRGIPRAQGCNHKHGVFEFMENIRLFLRQLHPAKHCTRKGDSQKALPFVWSCLTQPQHETTTLTKHAQQQRQQYETNKKISTDNNGMRENPNHNQNTNVHQQQQQQHETTTATTWNIMNDTLITKPRKYWIIKKNDSLFSAWKGKASWQVLRECRA